MCSYDYLLYPRRRHRWTWAATCAVVRHFLKYTVWWSTNRVAITAMNLNILVKTCFADAHTESNEQSDCDGLAHTL
jgi:hypothetical protein